MGPEITPEPPVVERNEWPQIEAWRLHVLTQAGYPARLAAQLAADHTVDLHQAVELTKRGCPFGAAARILL